jgi:sporulation protein YlmC with PRC-barrel domain
MATAEATEAVVETPADAATPTVEGATGAIPQTGMEDDCNVSTVQGLLDMDVVDGTGAQIGDVDKLVILRDAKANAAEQAGENRPFTAMTAPQVAYVVIDLENEDNEAVVPFSAFDLTTLNQGVGGMDGDADAAQATPALDAAGTPVATVAAGDAVNEAVVCAITLNNVDAAALAGSPAFGDDFDFSVPQWDNEFRTYWSGLGLISPSVDAGLGAPVVLGDEFNNINARSLDGEDLGEVEDFIFDTGTGSFTHAVLAVGGFLGIGEKYAPVPMTMVQWIADADDKDEVDDTGEVVVNINAEDVETAPLFDSLDDIDTTVEGWDNDVETFWNNLKTE